MGMVAPQQRIASAYFVVFGKYGDVSRYAEERGVCRQARSEYLAAIRAADVGDYGSLIEMHGRHTAGGQEEG